MNPTDGGWSYIGLSTAPMWGKESVLRVWSVRLAGLFALLSMLTIGAGAAFAQQAVNVELADFSFSQKTFSARVGEKFTFNARNVGQRPHDIKIEGPGGFTWEMVPGNGSVAPGTSGSGEVTFSAPGTYEVYCPVGNHRGQGMVASFTVLAAGPAGQAGQTLPRSGDPMGLLAAGFAGLGALSFGAGIVLRRRG